MDAKKHLQKAIELDPNYADAYYELGLLFKKDNESKALEHFESSQFKEDFAEAQCELAIMFMWKMTWSHQEIIFLTHLLNPTTPNPISNTDSCSSSSRILKKRKTILIKLLKLPKLCSGLL